MSNKKYVMNDLDNLQDESAQSATDVSPLAAIGFKPIKDAISLDANLKASAPEFQLILSLFCSRSRQQRFKIAESFEQSFNQPLINLISKVFKSKESAAIIRSLCSDEETALCFLLNEAITTQRAHCLAFLVKSRATQTWGSTCGTYKQLFKKNVTEEISKHFPTEVKELILPALQSGGSKTPEFDVPEREAANLTKDLNKKGTSRLISLYGHTSPMYMKQVTHEFYELTETTLYSLFKDKLKPGSAEVIKVFEDLYEEDGNCCVRFLKKYLSTDSDFCFSLIVLRADTDLVDICKDYQRLFTTTLLGDCEQIFGGDQLYVLQTIIPIVFQE